MTSARIHTSSSCPTLTGKRCSGFTREYRDGPLRRYHSRAPAAFALLLGLGVLVGVMW